MRSMSSDKALVWLCVFVVLLWAINATASPASAQTYHTGARAVSPEVYQRFPAWQPAGAPRIEAGAARVDLRALMPPVGDQGPQGSCVAWAVGYAALSYTHAYQYGQPPRGQDRQFSPAYLYNQINVGRDEGKDMGSYVHEALALLHQQGCAPLSTVPYNPRDYRTQPRVEAMLRAADHRINSYARIESLDYIKQALRHEYPIIITIRTSQAFMQGTGRWRIYDAPTHTASLRQEADPEKHALHAVCVVGYDDTRKALLIKNSWGPRWGEGGYFWADYDLFRRIGPRADNFCMEAWVIEPTERMTHDTAVQRLRDAGRDFGIHKYQDAYWNERHNRPEWRWHALILSGRGDPEQIARVVWRYQSSEGAHAITVHNTPDAFAGLGIEGIAQQPGELTIRAEVHLRDGRVQQFSDALLFLKFEPPALRIATLNWYYGQLDWIDGKAHMWSWKAYLAADEAAFNTVDRVEWRMPEHYRDARVTVRNADESFEIARTGPLPAAVDAIVVYRDGRHRLIRKVIRGEQPRDRFQFDLASVGGFGDPWWGVDAYLRPPGVAVGMAIDRVVFSIPGQGVAPVTVANDGSWGQRYATEFPRLMHDTTPPRRFDVVATVHFKDGRAVPMRSTITLPQPNP